MLVNLFIILNLVLNGYISNQPGRLGILTNKASSSIVKVYKHGPSFGLLEKGDRILSVDGVKGSDKAITYAGEEATVVVERNGQVLTFKIIRAGFGEVHD